METEGGEGEQLLQDSWVLAQPRLRGLELDPQKVSSSRWVPVMDGAFSIGFPLGGF